MSKLRKVSWKKFAKFMNPNFWISLWYMIFWLPSKFTLHVCIEVAYWSSRTCSILVAQFRVCYLRSKVEAHMPQKVSYEENMMKLESRCIRLKYKCLRENCRLACSVKCSSFFIIELSKKYILHENIMS